MHNWCFIVEKRFFLSFRSNFPLAAFLLHFSIACICTHKMFFFCIEINEKRRAFLQLQLQFSSSSSHTHLSASCASRRKAHKRIKNRLLNETRSAGIRIKSSAHAHNGCYWIEPKKCANRIELEKIYENNNELYGNQDKWAIYHKSYAVTIAIPIAINANELRRKIICSQQKWYSAQQWIQ